ncbi:alpha/beta fold hydrolase [Sphingobacterium sp. LRF_L2]|uniref:alpha/beta fold hydrolase n=1 Tax=Sphingobacterium sp. LRF_L2 TaxID=3369421 RepID=UPI003F60A9BB
MSTIVNQTNSEETQLHVLDYGSGQPVILIHGWPLSHNSWERQIPAIVKAGFRVIAYDRRGFGQSSAPWNGYNYDTFANDLNAIITKLQLSNVILVGFSMGGGEVIRYLSTYGEHNVSKIALISSIIPLVKQKEDNPDGVPDEKLQEIISQLTKDRLGFLKGFHQQFYGADSNPFAVSDEQLDYDFIVSSQASAHATVEAAKAWMDTDFRTECERISVPTLIVHGKKDVTVPFETAAAQAAVLIKHSLLITYNDAPHGLNITHADRLNTDLLGFFES